MATAFIVMELVDGEELAHRIARGPTPLDEALPIAKQIADALEAAHDQGIVHRDLKPANIKVRRDGTVKVLDFGLAKAMDPADASAANVMNSPTMTRLRQGYGGAGVSGIGMIIGTAAYMAPEQAQGRAVDKRADIWAFGAVLYEMLAGHRAFRGDDTSETLASVLKDAPDFTALPADTPPRLRALLERCLERDVKNRLRDIGEARVEFAKIAGGQGDPSSSSGAMPPPAPSRAWWNGPIGLAAALLAGALGSTLLWRFVASPLGGMQARPIRASLAVPNGAELQAVDRLLAVSPDGSQIVLAALRRDAKKPDAEADEPCSSQEQAVFSCGRPSPGR